MELLGSAVHAQLVADGAHQAPRDRDAVRGEDLARVAEVEQPRESVRVTRELPVVAVVEPAHRLEGGRVDVVGGSPDGRKASGEVGLTEAVRGGAQVVQRAEAAEGLPEHAPPVDAEVLAEALGVLHDRVRPEVREPLGVGGAGRVPGRRTAWNGPCRAGRASAPGSRAAPARARRGRRTSGGTRGLLAGTALEEHQEGAVAAVGGRDLAGEHLDGLAVGAAVVERDGEHVVGEDQPGNCVWSQPTAGLRHRAHVEVGDPQARGGRA